MNQELLEKMRTYPDTRILNTIKQSNFFDPEIVEVAKFIAEEKGLTSPEKIKLLEKTAPLKKLAIQQIHQGIDPQEIKSNLMNEGLDEEMAKDVLTDAARSVTIGNVDIEDEKSNKGISGFMIAFIAFFVLRMIFRMMRD